jgi:hypothetical protein
VTRYATVRLRAAAVFAVFVVGATAASAQAAEGGVGVGTLLLSLVLGLVSFGALAFLLLFDARRRHQLVRALSSLLSPGRFLMRGERSDDDGSGDDQRAEMRRRLEYAREGLRSAVGTEPATAGATSRGALADVRPPRLTAREALRERRSQMTTRVPETTPVVVRSPGPEKDQVRLPVSPRVAHGAPLVRVTATSCRKTMGITAARSRLMRLRRDDDRLMRRAAVSRWCIRGALLLLVPAILCYQVLSGTSWLTAVWDDVASRGGLLVALALGAAGSAWSFVVTRPDRGFRHRAVSKSASHAIRSLSAYEQLALRLSVDVAPADAWRAVALTAHFPPESAIPATGVEEALSLVEELRRLARRRHKTGVRRLVAAVARPLLTCLLPASVIILLL